MPTPTEQSIPETEVEPQTSQQEEMPSVASAITETFDNKGDGANVSLPADAIASKTKPSIFKVDNLSQAFQQEETLPLVVAPITEALNNEESVPGISSPAVVIASEAKQSTSEVENLSQISQQEVTSPWIAAVSSGHALAFSTTEIKASNNDEAAVSAVLQKAKAEGLRQGNNNARTSTHLFWLTGLLLLSFLFFCRATSIVPYRVKNVLTIKTAENLNTPGYLRDAA
jgi:hypothetical protein